ncbi:hypothetical protein ACLFMI_14320 [Pseudonocardia nantongensis]|uniref:hypothetical protein n=1 Tax=Pseudonocardia nantongensis TaxID=1181885 RepID=UPI00397B7A54
MEPIPYTDDVEQIGPDEDDHIQRCIAAMQRTNAMTFDLHRHGYRATHAKSHGILRGDCGSTTICPPSWRKACSPDRRPTPRSPGSRPRPASSTTTGHRTPAGSR